MSPSADGRIDQEVVDALGALGNRTRLEILLALAEAEREQREQPLSMPFTALYDAVDIDSTSQFSYHLDRLVGRFVAETADGYRLTYGGTKIVRTIRSGLYETTHGFDDVAVPGACMFCEGTSLVATVADERFVVRCESCEATVVTDLLSRSQTRNRSATEIVDSVGHRIWSTYALVRGGVCPECYGPIDTAATEHDHDGRPLYTLESTCRECRFTVHMPIEVSAAFHPVALEFFWKHGISLPDTPIWEFFEYLVTDAVTTDVVGLDPLEATFAITLDGETLRLEMDDSLAVSPVTSADD